MAVASNDGGPVPEAGWYPDPDNPEEQMRWWGGKRWGDMRRPRQPGDAAPDGTVTDHWHDYQGGVRWQYRVVNTGMFNTADRLVRVLGDLGAHGWELVGIYDKSSNWIQGAEKGFVLFKRAVPEGVEPETEWAAWQRG
jgi:hypothetical protein